MKICNDLPQSLWFAYTYKTNCMKDKSQSILSSVAYEKKKLEFIHT